MQNQDQLRKSEAKYRSLIEAMHQGILVHRNYKILFANQASVQMLGYEHKADLMATDLRALYAEEDRAFLQAKHKEMLEADVEPFYIERRLFRKDKLDIWTKVMAIKVDWEGTDAILIVLEDITDRKRSEEALRETAEKFRSIMDYSLTVDLLKDLDGRYLLVNHRFEQLHGVRAAQVIGKTAFDIMPRDLAEKLAAQEREVLRTGKPVESELVFDYNDGTRQMINIKFPVYSPSGKIIGVGTTATDITDRKNLELQYREVQKLQAVSILAGGVAHSFNNLLQVIMSNIYQLMEGVDPADPQFNLLATINKQVEKGAEITGLLLGFAQEGKYRPVVTNLNLALVGITSMILKSYKNIDLQLEIDEALQDTRADERQIEQALMIVVVNACEAMPQGGTLSVATRNVRIDEGHDKIREPIPGTYVNVSVKDTGVGIPEEVLPHIFEPFFTTREVGDGHGLGLASASGIVRNHNGYITVDSTVDVGTVIDIYLPAVQPPDAEGAPVG